MAYSRSVPAARPSGAALLFGWMGGALFAASLGVFFYSYELRYPRQIATPSVGAFTFDVLLFTIFALHHSLLARTPAKRWLARRAPVWLERPLFTWTASLLFIVVCIAWRPPGGSWYSLPQPWRGAGYALQAVGLVLGAAGSAAVDVLDLAGVRQILASRAANAPAHTPLKTNGVFGIVRHPLYLGWALFVLAAPTMTASRALFAIVSTGYLAMAIPLEEQSLVNVFGDEYRAYQRRTRWRMLPGIW